MQTAVKTSIYNFSAVREENKFPLTLIDIHAQLPPFEQEHNREMKIQCEMDKYRLVNRPVLRGEILFLISDSRLRHESEQCFSLLL